MLLRAMRNVRSDDLKLAVVARLPTRPTRGARRETRSHTNECSPPYLRRSRKLARSAHPTGAASSHATALIARNEGAGIGATPGRRMSAIPKRCKLCRRNGACLQQPGTAGTGNRAACRSEELQLVGMRQSACQNAVSLQWRRQQCSPGNCCKISLIPAEPDLRLSGTVF